MESDIGLVLLVMRRHRRMWLWQSRSCVGELTHAPSGRPAHSYFLKRGVLQHSPQGGRQWQAPLPESVAVWPATGMNCHVYVPSPRVSLSTPYTLLIRASLFGMMSVLVPSRPSPPVPTMISRMPFTGSATPAGVWGANRS